MTQSIDICPCITYLVFLDWIEIDFFLPLAPKFVLSILFLVFTSMDLDQIGPIRILF